MYYLMVNFGWFSGSILLESKIQLHTAYQKQQVNHCHFGLFLEHNRLESDHVTLSLHRKL